MEQDSLTVEFGFEKVFVIVACYGELPHDLFAAVKRFATIVYFAVCLRKECFDVKSSFVTQIGQGEDYLLQDSDARIVRVVIGPNVSAQFLDITDAFEAKRLVVKLLWLRNFFKLLNQGPLP